MTNLFNSDKFTERAEKLVQESDKFTVRIASYAKDKIAVRFHNTDGFKSRENDVLERALNWDWGKKMPYSVREKAYIISVSQCERFISMLQDHTPYSLYAKNEK